MSIRSSLLILLCVGLGMSLQAHAERRDGVWVFQAESPRYYNRGRDTMTGTIVSTTVRINTTREALIPTIRSTRATCRRVIRVSFRRNTTTAIEASSDVATGVRNIASSVRR